MMRVTFWAPDIGALLQSPQPYTVPHQVPEDPRIIIEGEIGSPDEENVCWELIYWDSLQENLLQLPPVDMQVNPILLALLLPS
jgi:hypothetical protein